MSDLLSRLELTQSRLGNHYIGIGSNFEDLLKEMKLSFVQSQKLVNDFKAQISESGSQSLRSLMDQIETLSDREAGNHKALIVGSNILLEKLSEIYIKLSFLKVPINEIQDAADLMSLLALNSMVVAIQAGSKGGGFTCITDDLKTASSSAHSIAGEIMEKGRHVNNDYNRFTSLSDRIRGSEADVRTFLDKNLPENFDSFDKYIVEFIDYLEKMSADMEMIRPALMKIMQSIQNQDVIRQSMDHILISLRELEKGSVHDEIGEVGFILLKQQLYSLGHLVLSDIMRWLESDLENLDDSSRECENILVNLDKDRQKFLSQQKDKSPGSRSLARQLFSIREDVEKVLEKNDSANGMWEELFDENRSLVTSLLGLGDRINSLSELIELFHNINVLARIEIARTNVFGNIESAVSEMEGINHRIEEAVDQIMKVEHFIRSGSKENELAFQEKILKSSKFVNVFRNDINRLLIFMEESVNLLYNTLDDCKVFSARFTDLFFDSKNQIGNIQACHLELLKLDGILEKEIKQLDLKIEKISPEEVNHPKNQERIGEILSHFTIFKHKKEASLLAGIDVDDEEDMEQSSIILF